jgi:hypothetical protein
MTWISSSGGHAFAAVRILQTQALRSRRVSPSIEASHRAQILSLPAEPLLLVLWLNQVTLWFVVNHHKPCVQTPVVSRYPALALIHDFFLLFLPPCGPHLIPFGHRVHRAEPT